MGDRPQLFMVRERLDDLPGMPAMPEGYVLREMRAGDEAEMARLMALTFDPEWPLEKVRKVFVDDPNVRVTYVIECGEALVATASVQVFPQEPLEIGTVHMVAADPDHKGKKL